MHVTGEKPGVQSGSMVNMREAPDRPHGFVNVHNCNVTKPNQLVTVTVSNKDADGYVVVDAVQFLPRK